MGKEKVEIIIDAKDSASKKIGAVNRVLGGMASVATGMIAANVLTGVARGMASLGTAAISVESAMAGVTKTTDGLVDNMGNLTYAGEVLKSGFRELAKEIPMSVEELMHIGELGGQLGITQDNLLDFTETIAALGVTTNLSTEDAAMSLAQLMNVMGTNQKDIDKLGSVIVDLGNNFATTEADIVAFASRIAGVGKIAGLTEADVMGISAAFSSVGIEAEAGGTAVQKVLMEMNQAVAGGAAGLWAATAGMTSMEFQQLWGTDPAKAFQAFVEGLGRAGDDAINILDQLELKDQRLIRSFLSLSKAGNLLGDSIERGTEAWGENNALMKEAEQRYRTAQSQVEIFRNRIRDVAITIGDALLPIINDMLTALSPVVEAFHDAITTGNWGGLSAALTNLWSTHIWPTLSSWATKFWDWLSGEQGAIAAGVFLIQHRFAPQIVHAFSQVWPGIAEELSSWPGKFWEWLTDPTDGAIGKATGAMDSLAATLRGIAKDPAVQDQAQQAGRSLAHGMIDGIKGIFTGEGGEETVNFLDLIYGLGNSIMDAIRGVWDIITTIGAEFAVGIMIGIAEFITGKKAKDDLGDSLVSVLESILKLPLWVLYGQEWAGALWQSFKDAIGSMSLSGLGNLGGLLSFQSGGMVPGPIGAPTLAMVHGGEMVLNPQQQSVVNNYFNQTVNTRAEQSSVIQDFNMLKSLAGVA